MESLLKLGVSESQGQTLVSQWITPILVVVSAALVRPSHSDASERHAFSITSKFVFLRRHLRTVPWDVCTHSHEVSSPFLLARRSVESICEM
jgi:hypothetical protein